MGHKVHPTGFRIGIIRDWQSKWYSSKKQYVDSLHEDLKLRKAVVTKYTEAGVSLVDIDRQANKISVTIHTSRPGIVIGRGGQRVEEMRQYLENVVSKKIQLNIQEIQQPELDAYLVARNVADQIERHVAYRRAMKQAIFRTLQAGAKGMRINCSGRLGGAEIARRLMMHEGRVPLHTMRADIDYGFTEAATTMGRIGVKVWIYKGDVLPEAEVVSEMISTGSEKTPVAGTEPARPARTAELEVKDGPA
jgi:small subunit ribosomal protein S3